MAKEVVWIEINPETLPERRKMQYAKMKASYQAYRGDRSEFESGLAEDAQLPPGKRMVFGYNYGKLSVAIVDDDRKPAAKPKLSLADFLATQQASGLAF